MKLRLHLLLAASWVFRVSLVAWVCVVSRTFLCHKGFPGEGPVLLDPLLLVQQQVDQKILELNLSVIEVCNGIQGRRLEGYWD